MLFEALAGVMMKTYDDILDNKIEISPGYMDLVKVLLVCFFTIAFLRNTGLSVMAVIGTAMCYMLNQVDSPFWQACMAIPVLTTLANYNRIVYVGVFDTMERILAVLGMGLVFAIESHFFPEEYSEKKIYGRFFVVMAGIPLLQYTSIFSAGKAIGGGLAMGLGYAATSVFNNLHKLFEVVPATPPATPEKVSEST